MNSEVYEGKDGWLFLIGGTNAVGTLYRRDASRLSDAKLRQWVKLIEGRARRLDRMNIQYVHVAIPEKLTIYDNKLHDPPLVDWRLSPAMRLGEMLQHSSYAHVWLDLIGPLRAARDAEQLFMKTDTHWTAEGCYLAYKAICERIGIAPELDLLSRPYQDQGGYLDLGMKLDPRVAEAFRFYDFTKNATRWRSNAIAQNLDKYVNHHKPVMHVGSHVAFRNAAASTVKKKILIFGDSFASQGSNALTGMLAESATDVEFIWSSNLDWTHIRRARPDVVIYELVERFMTALPKDNMSMRWRLARQGLRAKWLLYRARCWRSSAESG